MKNIYHKLDAQLQFDGLKVMRYVLFDCHLFTMNKWYPIRIDLSEKSICYSLTTALLYPILIHYHSSITSK